MKKKLGRKDYHAYIKSEEWSQVKKRFYSSKMYKVLCEGDRWSCYCCGTKDKPLDLHHRTYKRLGMENIALDLVPVCRECHHEIHEIAPHVRNSLWGATKFVKRKKQKQKQ
jgi:hypothetical protein